MSTDTPTRYGIGTVARLTGLTTHNIRAWENRYAAIEAERDASGRRRYTPEQVERLAKLKQLVDLGERISNLSKLPSTALDERLTALRPETAMAPVHTTRLRLGIYGSSAAALTKAVRQHHPQHKIIASDDALTAEQLTALEPDVDCLIVATASLAPGLVPILETLSRQSGERAVVVVYDFARDADLRALAGGGLIILRNPLGPDDLQRAFVEVAQKMTATEALQQVTGSAGGDGRTAAERLNESQLSRIGAISTSIECECPHHMVTLINNLRAFEQYSKDCTNRNREDAVIHEFLYRETLRANQIIENALRHLLDYENITL